MREKDGFTLVDTTTGDGAYAVIAAAALARADVAGVLGHPHWPGDCGKGSARGRRAACGLRLLGRSGLPQARHAEGLRLLQELAVSGLAAVAWYASGAHLLGVALAAWSIVYHAVVYASGAHLLKPVTALSHRAGL